MENKFLTVGTDYINEELFSPIMDDGIKPRGGLWLSKYEGNNFNRWVDFMLLKKYLLFYKSKGDPFNQPCSIVTLKDNANIFLLNNDKDLFYLFNNYSYKDNISYGELSKDYDGIIVNISNFSDNDGDYYRDLTKAFGINSLILFNLDCIDYYYAGKVMIDPFDPEDRFFDTYYSIKFSDEKKKVLKRG